MYIFDIISMDGKLKQLERASFDVFLKGRQKIVLFLVLLIDKFSKFRK